VNAVDGLEYEDSDSWSSCNESLSSVEFAGGIALPKDRNDRPISDAHSGSIYVSRQDKKAPIKFLDEHANENEYGVSSNPRYTSFCLGDIPDDPYGETLSYDVKKISTAGQFNPAVTISGQVRLTGSVPFDEIKVNLRII